MSAVSSNQVNWNDMLGRTLDGVLNLGAAYFDADQATEVPDFAAFQAQQQAAAAAAEQRQQSQMSNMLLIGGVALAFFFLARS
jgi:flagellin-like hook-associated protein FlgL